MLSILYVVSGSTVGGAERQLLYYLEGARRDDMQFSVITLLGPSSSARRSDIDLRTALTQLGIPQLNLDLHRFPTLAGMIRFGRALRQQRADVLHAYGIRAELASRLLAPPSRYPRLVSSIRGPERQRPTWLCRVDARMPRIPHAYFANSSLAAREYSERGGIPPSRIRIIPNGIDTAAFEKRDSPTSEELRNQFGVSSDDLLGICVANVHEAKGHHVLLHSVSALQSRYPRVKYLLVGADRSRGEIPALIHELGLENTVILTGPRRDIPSLLAASDFFVLTSLWEGLSNSLMEAMAAGLPILATAVGGTPELLDHLESAFLVPPDSIGHATEGLASLLENPELRTTLANNAHQRIRSEFSVSRMVERTTSSYRDLLSTPM